MLPTATIVFREFLEIALILCIVLAATTGMRGRWSMTGIGLAIGVVGSVIIAFFTNSISNAVDGMGQEVFNAGIMFVAVLFLSWTVIWMKSHARQMSQQIKELGQQVVSGERSQYVLIGVIALATFREGAEIVLFTKGMILSGQFTIASIVTGGVLGAIGGSLVGLMIYMGLLKAARKHLFAVTSWMLILLTAGMAAKGASFLVAADILPALGFQIWDTSNILSGHSIVGEILGVMIGYTPRPSGMELLFYGAVLVVVGGLYRSIGRTDNVKAAPAPAA